MRVFKLKPFVRAAKKSGISDDMLLAVVDKAEKGLVHGDLGGHVIKQRVGPKGSHRVLIHFKAEHAAFFAFMFAKGDRENIEDDELEALLDQAAVLLALKRLGSKRRSMRVNW